MKPLTLLLAALLCTAAVPAGPAAASHDRDDGEVRIGHLTCEPPVDWAPRHDAQDARFAIDTEDGGATLLLTDELLAFQLSDRMFARVRRELRDDQEDTDNALSRAIKAAVYSSVRSLLASSVQCRLRDVRDVTYERGELRIYAMDGRRMFQDMDVNDHDVTRSFREADARAFVREFRRAKSRLRQ